MKKNSGFTIMELLTVIGIIGILSAVAVPNMIGWRNNMQFNSSLRQVKIALEETRMDAIKSNMPSRMDFNVGGHSFDRVKWDPTANAFAAPETRELSPGTTITGSTFTANQVQFSSRGMANNGTLTIRGSAGQTRQIIVALTGSARIQ